MSGPGGSWETVTTALEKVVGQGRQSGSWMKYCCPVHEADGRVHRPSLIVKHLDDKHRTKLRCQAGCDDRQVLAALGLHVRDLYDRPLARGQGPRRPAPRVHPRQISRADRAIDAAGLPLTARKKDRGQQLSPWREVATYPYAREDGMVAGEVIRTEAEFEHGRDKAFTQRHWADGRMKPGGFEPLPFQLPAVLAGIEAGEPVYVVEGEKDVVSAMSAGLIATCNAGGALSWTPEHARWLAGAREVVIVADHDAPGYRRAERVMATLTEFVARIRVLGAATGKDITDHLSLGHDVGELVPIPYLDPHTAIRPVPDPARRHRKTTQDTAAEAVPVSAASFPTPGETTMGEQFLAPQLHDVPADQTPDIDHAAQQWQMFTRLLLQQMIVLAQRHAQKARERAEAAARAAEAEQREYAARRAAELKGIETRLSKLKAAGMGNATRGELAAAVRDAAAWAQDSQVARSTLEELRVHVHERFGLRLDAASGTVEADVPRPLLAALAGREAERAADARLRRAQDRMVRTVAAVDIDESTKTVLYAQIDEWRRNPSTAQMKKLGEALKTAGIGEQVRQQVRFVAHYLGESHQVVPIAALADGVGESHALQPLRAMDAPLVDPGEEAKPRVDNLLGSYQARLRHGLDTTEIARKLTHEIAVMTPEDQAKARARGKEIRRDPTIELKRVWPKHVDRDELADAVRMYAILAPNAEHQAVAADDLDVGHVTQLRERAAIQRRSIEHAIKHGEGLHALERDQLACVLRDIEAGRTTLPALLFADDRSAAAADSDRADTIASNNARFHRHQLDKILDSHQVPDGVKAAVADQVSTVFIAQQRVAAGVWSLGDYEHRNPAALLDAKLTAAGAPEGLRNKVRNHLREAVGESTSTGQTARRRAERWGERRAVVAAGRSPARNGDYDSPQRRASLEAGLRDAGLGEDTVGQRMAADASNATPPSHAVANKPGESRRGRQTSQGSGVRRAYGHKRGRGGEHGYDR